MGLPRPRGPHSSRSGLPLERRRAVWIIENGIKDTGMIALGPTHQPQDIWAVAAFVRQLPDMTPERYHELVTRYQAQRAQIAQTSAHSH